MQPTVESRQRLAQPLQKTPAILVVQEARQPVVAPLHHVLLNPGEIEPRT
jgi:hypothetical protein